MKKKISSFIILTIILFILAFNFIIIKGREYTVKINNYDFSNINVNDIQTIQHGDNVTLINKKINNGILELTYRYLSIGKTDIEINYPNYYNYFHLYVHHFGIITYDNFFGDSNGDAVIPITMTILLIVLIYMVYDSYKKSVNKSLYQYKNMYYLGLIIFLIFNLFSQCNIFNYQGLYDTFSKYLGIFELLSYILLPIGFITFLFVSISNIVLIIKEGFSFRNMLGIILGILLLCLTFLPEFMYRFTYNDLLINIHNTSSIMYYIYTFVEVFIYSLVAYLECILLAVIILSIKASKRIPNFNKDYIIILGCMINKDGSLTNLLKGRVDRAIEFRNMQLKETNKDLIFITSGGKGSDEIISEGLAMKKYLLKKGIPNKKIIVEDKSTSTNENFKYSLKLSKRNKEYAFSTTNFHVFRTGVEAYNLGINVEGIGSVTKKYFWINAFIREFIATMYYEKKNHIIIFVLLILINVIFVSIICIANLL